MIIAEKLEMNDNMAVAGEAGDVSTETIESWNERAREITRGWKTENIWNMDETDSFFFLLFMDNVPCHPESLKGKFSNINAVFLPKNTTSKTPPHDAGIIASWKVLYRKRMLRYTSTVKITSQSVPDLYRPF